MALHLLWCGRQHDTFHQQYTLTGNVTKGAFGVKFPFSDTLANQGKEAEGVF
jgi:hypothetical protein